MRFNVNKYKEKDLGVIIANKLNYSKQWQPVTSKAHNIFCTWKDMAYRDKSIILPLFKALVQPHLEYIVQFHQPLPPLLQKAEESSENSK